jgi:hypothetical protein
VAFVTLGAFTELDDAQASSCLWLKTHSLDNEIVKVPVLDNPDLALKLVDLSYGTFST